MRNKKKRKEREGSKGQDLSTTAAVCESDFHAVGNVDGTMMAATTVKENEKKIPLSLIRLSDRRG